MTTSQPAQLPGAAAPAVDTHPPDAAADNTLHLGTGPRITPDPTTATRVQPFLPQPDKTRQRVKRKDKEDVAAPDSTSSGTDLQR